MSGWTARRFYTQAEVAPVGDAWEVRLDDKPIRTPGKSHLLVPTRALALAIAEEWQAQEDRIDPGTMPMTRFANSALDKVRPQHDEVARMLAGYGETDLLSHRADHPPELVARQGAAWDPWLDWLADRHGARLATGAGVMPVAQDPEALARLSAVVADRDPFALMALHDLVGLSGSLVLGLAMAEGVLPWQQGWDLSRIDEDWQIEQWGEDEEAADAARLKRRGLEDAARFGTLAGARGQLS